MSPAAEQWIRERRAVVLPKKLSIEFDTYLCGLPWMLSALDWAKMPRSVVVNLARADPEVVLSWAQRTTVGRHTHIAIWYSANEGGVVVPLKVGLVSLDELYWGAPGVRFAFGIDFDGGAMEPAYTDFLQYGAGDALVALAA